MNPATIYHRPLSEYAFALDDTHYVFRLRTGKGEAQCCKFYYADRAIMTPELEFFCIPMEKIREDLYFDWYEIRLETGFARIAYYFELSDGAETLSYYGDCYELVGQPNRADYFQLPFNHRADRLEVPEWTKDAIVYNIFPDSFADGKRTLSGNSAVGLGGTIKGITENLDYIASMGFNCIYMNPIFKAESYHRYDTLDYYEIDPQMGTKDDLKTMVQMAHSMGIRVILDGVFNHISSSHFMFRDVLEHGQDSEYYGCFYQLPEHPEIPDPGEYPQYTCFSYVSNMPKTNTANSFLCQYFCDVGTYWIREFDIDGWRLDVANELDDGFLRAFRSAVKREKRDALIVGEVWENAAHYLGGDMLDSAMNYDFRRYCRRFFAEETVRADVFDSNVSTLLLRYRENALYAQLNLLDSHDVSRYMTLCDGNANKMELSVLLQMTFPGMPCVFYGDEKGLCGISEREYRQAMEWEEKSPMEDVYRRLIALRRAHPALRYGSFRTNIALDQVYSYSRIWNGQKITVTMNLGGAPIRAPKQGRLLLKKGENHGIIGAWEYEVREEKSHGSDDL
ncbi:MAG: glycoside hydrolase family 13 protein [Firmicutes bacterium]|nr:glycoside hydrolase family 13 protein [Bacillota bacterium]